MEFGPIWRAALRNKTGAVLVVLQIAFAQALIVNSVAIAERNARLLLVESGIDEDNVFHLQSSAFDNDLNARATIEDDLRRIRGTPGVIAAVQTNSIPISGGGMNRGLKTTSGDDVEEVGTSVYYVDEQGIDALGVRLIAGENFVESEVQWDDSAEGGWPSRTILSRALAEVLFPDDPTYGVGKVVYIDGSQPMTVAGIVEKLMAPWPGWDFVAHSILVPRHPVGRNTRYLVRAEPRRRDALMPAIEAELASSEPGRIIQDMLTMEQTRERNLDGNEALVNILSFTVAVLVAITTLGVAGLTSFNVTRRYKQIGTRRALGASRVAILRYFLAENLLFTALGVLLGGGLAIAINLWLVESYSVPRFSWFWLPVSMVGLVAISLLAVLLPARRAGQVSPAVATRSV